MKVGNTMQPSALYNWAFTLNNWTEKEHSALISHFKDDEYLIAKEVGSKTETPHLHGYIHLRIRKRFQSMLNAIGDKRIHWERVNNVKKYLEYIQKEGDFVTNMRLPRPIIYPDFKKPWQLDILELIKTQPNDRTLHWYWESIGNVGKTVFAKYLCDKLHGVIIPPKRSDAWHFIAKLLNDGILVDLLIIDIPRHDLDFVNYGALEKIKDGFFASGKYKTASCIFQCPHVIVFANSPPDEYKMSADRWKTIQITE